MQAFKHSSAVAQSAEFIQFAVDDDDQNLRFLDALTHSMKWVILQTFYQVGPHSGESYSKLWKWMSCCPHLDLQFRYIFCGVRLTETRNTEVQDCIDPTASEHQILSGKCPSHIIPGLSKSKQYKRVHIQARVLSILCHDVYAMIYIDPGETLIFATLLSTTVPCSSLCMIILYGGSPLSSSRINQRQAICMALC